MKDYPIGGIVSGSASAIWERGQTAPLNDRANTPANTTVVYQGGGVRPMMTDSDVYRLVFNANKHVFSS